ncbi:hypothetical protein BUALT_Bualt17G0111300 [Buddleja alternifolia]|uniref:Pectinesterase n=1 Tax=Buddleja alternifolia TaxID=168488 RepID=A0AAV6WIE6_9LAMI|nr:hypothetical protein BUALT_Bualt17G0111300 [Buddleja alternifolia]
MDKHISLLGFLSVVHILLAHFGLAKCVATYTSVCTQTPYPELCNSLISTTSPETTLDDENLFDFLDISLKRTLAQSQNTHKLISEMDLSSFTELGKSAWSDCLELYEDSVYQLNRSVGSNIDAQTWLSAAIANGKACENGFIDFNLLSHLESFSMLISDFPKFLSNSLAINNILMAASSSVPSSLYSNKQNRNRRLLANDHFPEWVSARDRKLLQSTIKADIVVAQDGSGNYKTISEALAKLAPKRRSGSKRFVIYVKKGIYKENVEVKKSMKNLMFIGDGIDATIITCSKSVRDGYTTFRSATFGEILDSIFYLDFAAPVIASLDCAQHLIRMDLA